MAITFGVLASGNAIAGGIILYEVGTEDVGLAAAGYAARAGRNHGIDQSGGNGAA